MKCNNCGRRLRPDAKICIFCERPVYNKNEKIVKEKKYVVIKS